MFIPNLGAILLSMESRSGQTVVNHDGSITFEGEDYECAGQWVTGEFVPSAAVPGEEVRVHTLPWKDALAVQLSSRQPVSPGLIMRLFGVRKVSGRPASQETWSRRR